MLYHEALSNRLLDIVASGLEGQEYVTVLGWIIKTYPSKELMGDASLGIPASKVNMTAFPGLVLTLQYSFRR